MFDKTYELPLARDYVRHWGVAEAVRELLQNALDSDSPLEYHWSDNGAHQRLTIRSKYGRLEPKTLLLGTTSKAEAKDKIGSFGEGYKIALLVLAREQRHVTVHNNDLRWRAEFRHSKQFDAEVLTIVEEKFPAGRGQGLTFLIDGLTPQDARTIIDSTLQMQESVGEVAETSKGDILYQRPGLLYVNGLFVCRTKMRFGYNIKPEFLKLERDRQTVSDFDLAWLTKDMWFETGLADKIAVLMADKAPDLEYANYGTPEVVKEACYRHFIEANPGAVLAKSKDELDSLVKKGMTRTVYLGGGSYTDAVLSSPSYRAAAPQLETQTPTQHLEAWLRENRGAMRTPAIVAFKGLIEQSKNWKAT